MLKPGGLDLSIAAEFDEGFPHAYFKMLRAEAPVCWHPERDGPGHWAITRYDDLKFASRNPQIFSSSLGGTTVRDLPPEQLERSRAIMLNMDPPQHAKYRRLVQRGLHAAHDPAARRRTSDSLRREIIDRVAPRGECEFVSEVAAELPMQIICEMMGVPEDDRRGIYELSNRLIGFEDPEYQGSLDAGIQASIEIFMYASKLSERARREPADDIVSALVSADVDGEKLSDLDFNSFFLVAGRGGQRDDAHGDEPGHALARRASRAARAPGARSVADIRPRSRRSCASTRR